MAYVVMALCSYGLRFLDADFASEFGEFFPHLDARASADACFALDGAYEQTWCLTSTFIPELRDNDLSEPSSTFLCIADLPALLDHPKLANVYAHNFVLTRLSFLKADVGRYVEIRDGKVKVGEELRTVYWGNATQADCAGMHEAGTSWWLGGCRRCQK